jgi:beta-phosphoglucomutase-like phosphatase (HAD superfamily)
VEGVGALIFDLDGTLVDTVYAHVFAWQQALAEADMPIDGWRIHRRIGMSVGLLSGGYGEDELTRAGAYRVYRDAAELDDSLDELGVLP